MEKILRRFLGFECPHCGKIISKAIADRKFIDRIEVYSDYEEGTERFILRNRQLDLNPHPLSCEYKCPECREILETSKRNGII